MQSLNPCYVFAAAALLLSACADDQGYRQAVLVGGSPIDDACGGSGIVREDLETVSVRARPTASSAPLDQLAGGTMVWYCDAAPGWVGVVYGKEAGDDCGVATPLAVSAPYAGRCKSGWIESINLTLLAG